MKPPIVVYEQGDVSLFDSLESAERALEPADIDNSEYRIFDSDGNELLGFIERVPGKGFWGRLGGTKERVKISTPITPSSRESELYELLAGYLAKVDPTFERSDLPRLSHLIARINQLGG